MDILEEIEVVREVVGNEIREIDVCLQNFLK